MLYLTDAIMFLDCGYLNYGSQIFCLGFELMKIKIRFRIRI